MGKFSNYKRVKHHQMPGDICKSRKILMREKLEHSECSRAGVKSWLRGIYAKTRAVLKRRSEREVW